MEYIPEWVLMSKGHGNLYNLIRIYNPCTGSDGLTYHAVAWKDNTEMTVVMNDCHASHGTWGTWCPDRTDSAHCAIMQELCNTCDAIITCACKCIFNHIWLSAQ